MNFNFDSIIFDLGGVILNIDYHKTITAFKNLGILNFEELYTQAKQNHIFDRFEKGLLSPKKFRQYINQHSSVKLSDEKIDSAWNAMLLDLPQKRIQLLEQLKTSKHIFLFSNTNAIHLKAFRQNIKKQYGNELLLENIFNKTYYSHLIGKRKPNADGFIQIIEENGLIPEKTLFIDDSPQHIEGAKKVGLQTLWLKDTDIVSVF